MAALLAHSSAHSTKSLSGAPRSYMTSPTFSDSQLDDLISDLISDRTLTTDQEDADSLDQGSNPHTGSITRHDANSRTTVSWTKNQSGPSRSISISSHHVSRSPAAVAPGAASGANAADGVSWLDSQRAKLIEKRGAQVYNSNQSYQSDSEHRVMGRRKEVMTSYQNIRQPVTSYDSLDELNDLLNKQQQQQQQHQRGQHQQKAQKYHQLQQRSCSVDAVREVSTGARTEPCFFVSGLEKPAFSKQQTKYVFAVSPSPSTLLRDDSLEDKFRAGCMSPPPPKRGDSSKEAVQRIEPRYVAPSVDELDQTLAKILQANSQPKPETEMVIEEEVISLQPIGRGIHTLEPDSDTLTRTRSRPSTPAAYPGFPSAGYRSPSLSRLHGGAMSPTSPSSTLRSGTPSRQNSASNHQQYSETSTTLTRAAAAHSASLNSLQGQGQAITRGQNQGQGQVHVKDQRAGADKPRAQELYQSSSKITSKEQDLEDAVSYMMANAESFSRPQTPAVLKSHTAATSVTSSHNHVTPTLPTGEKKMTYMEQQNSLLKQQQQLLLQSQQLQQLRDQEKTLKDKQKQLELELQQLDQQQPAAVGQQNGEWIVKEETITRRINNSGKDSGFERATNSNVSGQKQQHIADLEQQMLEIEQQMQQRNGGTSTGLRHQSHSSAAVQQLDDLSQQMQLLQQRESAADDQQQLSSAVSQQQRQQAVTAKFSSSQLQQQQQEDSITAESALGKNSSSGIIRRSPSPSLWTDETLRSYTSRKQSGSRSPLLPPGSTLPRAPGGAVSPNLFSCRTGSLSSMNDSDTLNHTQRFVRDSSHMWHRPNITREEAVTILRDKPPGSFIVRNSSTFQGAYGLALKVAQIPPNVQVKGGDPQTELVRHFLIEPTVGGVRLKGCSNEPVFSSLAALVYQHTITPLALPCKLTLPTDTEVKFVDVTEASAGALTQGAACNVLYLNSVDTESLTGPAALVTAIERTFAESSQPRTTVVQFKVSTQGITLTDHQRSLFFRRHYPLNTVSYCGIDESRDRRWTPNNERNGLTVGGNVFGFVARKPGSLTENCCHIFVESDSSQPASAIIEFLTKIMTSQGQHNKN